MDPFLLQVPPLLHGLLKAQGNGSERNICNHCYSCVLEGNADNFPRMAGHIESQVQVNYSTIILLFSNTIFHNFLICNKVNKGT